MENLSSCQKTEFAIEVISDVHVILRLEAFTESFHEEFRANFFQYFTLEEHAEHIAQLVARGVISEIGVGYGGEQFVEGYGEIGNFVLRAEIDGVSHHADAG